MIGKSRTLDVRAIHNEVTGSGILCTSRVNGKTTDFLLDFGLFQELKYDAENSIVPFDVSRLTTVALSHNHVDHTARVPLLYEKGYKGEVICSHITKKLLPYALNDTYGILKDSAERKGKKLLYTAQSVENTITNTEGFDYDRVIELNDNVSIRFLPNGHLLGSAMILMQVKEPGKESINLLFTGDYKKDNIFFNVPEIPKWVKDLPITIIQEATYGYMRSNEIELCFEDNIAGTIKKGGSVVALAFSLGRIQEILYKLKCMQREGKLDKEIPIYLDGKLAIKYTFFYINNPNLLKPEVQNFLPRNLIIVNNKSREKILFGKEQKIIVTSSGMGSHGPAQLYIPEYITRPNTLIQFTGYTAEGTMGRYLQEASQDKEVVINGVVLSKKARIECTKEYSAHSPQDKLLDFLRMFLNLKAVGINHATSETQKIYARKVKEEISPKDIVILGPENIFRFGPFGLVKSISTNPLMIQS